MLYVSTRNKYDSFTAFRALHQDHTPDGGLFVPFRLPAYDKAALKELKDGSFSQNVAGLLNFFFSAGLTAWDVEACAGRYPVKTHTMPHRIFMAEVWHNLDSQYSAMENSLYQKIAGSGKPSSWAKVAIRIAVLFGLYPQIPVEQGECFDITVAAGDFTQPMAAWYARKMGLPIGTIICGCTKNSGAWDLIHRGEFATGAAVLPTQLPELDVSSVSGVERLVYEVFGADRACAYRDICQKKGTYQLLGEDMNLFGKGLFSSVVSDQRAWETVNSTWRANGYITDPYTAMVYASLQDYRASTGESCLTVVMAEHSPVLFVEGICKTLSISEEQLKDRAGKL